MIFEYKGNKYLVIGRASLKDPTTGDWHDALIYKPYDNVTGEISYVRSESDFMSKFKLFVNTPKPKY